MLITNHQQHILDTLDILGGARKDQLAAFLRPAFALERYEDALRITKAAVRQMRYRNIPLEEDGDLVFYPGKRPGALLLEAVDIMLQLTDGSPLSYHREKSPILLRFSMQEQKVRLFCVIDSDADLAGVELYHTERVIQLFDGQGQARVLPVSNKQFYAARQSDGTYRFFAVGDQS